MFAFGFRWFQALAFAIVVVAALVGPTPVARAATTPLLGPAVGARFDTTHVYVAPADVDRFVASFLSTFGGTSTKQALTTVTPTASTTTSQLLITPVGLVSVFGFRTPVPYPFGSERTGYLVADMGLAVTAARSAGAGVIVAPFADPLGLDAVIVWPGGVNMQLYWHTTPPNYPELRTIPENRVYLAPENVSEFVGDFTRFASATVVSDDAAAPGVEIGETGSVYRRVRLTSGFGRIVLIASDGHLPYPYGRELTGYEVDNLDDTLRKATAAGATVLVRPYTSGDRTAAMVEFPGGYIAEIHAMTAR